ncbi:MAG: hypothetical protein WBG19_02975 [Thermoplasmata archaeon]
MSAIPLPQIDAVAGPAPGRISLGGSAPVVGPLFVAGLEFSLATSTLDALEAVVRSMSRERLRAWFGEIEGTEEAAVLSTCHRVELLLLLRSTDDAERWRSVLPGDPRAWRRLDGRSAVRHLFRVAGGLESLARGEAEARDQVRAAGDRIETRHPRPVLRELFAGAYDAAGEIAPAVPASRSIAAVAAAHLLGIVNRPRPRVVVLGSGTVGRQVAECLAPTARVTVLYHHHLPDDDFLRATGARAAPLEQLPQELVGADAVVTAAKFGGRSMRASELPRDRPLVLMDLGMPRNVDPEVRLLPNVRLVDLEELRAHSSPTIPPDGADVRAERLADRCYESVERRLLEPWIAGIRRAAEAVRRTELGAAREFLGTLDSDQERAIERLTRRLVDRLLVPPTDRIRALPPGPEGDLRRRLAAELLRPAPGDP